MKLIVFGGRDFTDHKLMDQTIKELVKTGSIDPTPTLISGMAKGADLAAHWLWTYEYDLPIIEMPADWSIGRQAGILRNIEMGNIADAGVGFWDGTSRGTKHMISYLNKLKKPCFICDYKGRPYDPSSN